MSFNDSTSVTQWWLPCPDCKTLSKETICGGQPMIFCENCGEWFHTTRTS